MNANRDIRLDLASSEGVPGETFRRETQQLCEAWMTYERAQADMEKATAGINAIQGKLTDLSLLPQLYAWYQDAADRNGFNRDTRNKNHKQFVFAVLMLYSPMSLYGGKIRNNLRQQIASLLHLRSHTILYHLRDKAVAWNQTYKSFALEVEVAYEELMIRLREQGVVE